jgi:hypothetical protein
MVAWWQVLIFIVTLQVTKWLGRYFLFKSTGVLFENIKSKFVNGGAKENVESGTGENV